MSQTIERITECIDALRALASEKISYATERAQRVYRDMDNTVLEVFGEQSPQYGDYKKHRMRYGPRYPYKDFEAGIPTTIELLEYFLGQLNRVAIARQRQTFKGLDLQPRIAAACADHFQNGQYRSAVSDACLALRDLVREKSGRNDLDGTPLMETVFSAKSPALAFNDLSDSTDEDEQRGMMHLFQGAWLALRNPRAHTLNPDSHDAALDYITFLNLLAKWVDKAKRIHS